MAKDFKSGMDPLSVLMVGLQILFVGLKLTGQIGWPWPLVLAPSIAYAALFTLVFAVVLATEVYDKAKR